MHPGLEAVKGFLERRYGELLGNDPFAEHDPQSSRHPVRHWVAEDLTPGCGEEAAAGLLVQDAEIGLLLYVLAFGPDIDLRAQVARALAVRSRLLPEAIRRDQARDENGQWRVALHWLVDAGDMDTWIEHAARLRSDTGHLEEVPVDALLRRGTDWPAAVEAHRMPRLLLATRAVLRLEPDQMERWSSADARVREALARFEDGFSAAGQKEAAAEVSAWLAGQPATSEGDPRHPPADGPLNVTHLGVRNLRNLKAIDLHFGADTPAAHVVQGPNGTGKSNLFEALYLALSGTSPRFEGFSADKDLVANRRTAARYRDQYLRRLGGASEEPPEVRLNGEPRPFLDAGGGTQGALARLAANLLSQEDSREFLRKDAATLAAEVLGDYSALADRVRAFAQARWDKSKEAQHALLREHGLNLGITRPETACDRAASRRIGEVAPYPMPLVRWLQSPVLASLPAARTAPGLAAEWKALSEQADALAKESAHLRDEAPLSERLRAYLGAREELLERCRGLLRQLSGLAAHQEPELARWVQDWGAWLATPRPETPALDPAQTRKLAGEQAELEAALKELAARGQSLAALEQHFGEVERFLEAHWAREHPDECPTCGTPLADRGGIREAMGQQRQENARALNAMRETYKKTNARLKAIRQQLTGPTAAKKPLTPDQEGQALTALAPLLPAGQGTEEALRDPEQRKALLNLIERLQRLPQVPQPVPPEELARQAETLARDLLGAFRRVEDTFAAPSAWQAVVKRLDQRLAQMVDQHLPDTLGALWHELVMNLTPAAWQLPGPPALRVDTKGRKTTLSVQLGTSGQGPLARYVLNEAESHCVGLAWFLVRYLTQGRFHVALLGLDDPAQEMDQTTYRDLCRLWGTLLRLHRVHALPLTLLVLLHQDERALDAGRATEGTLHVLKWNRDTAALARSLRLLGEQRGGPMPTPEGLGASTVSA
jgi:hypothetical protein